MAPRHFFLYSLFMFHPKKLDQLNIFFLNWKFLNFCYTVNNRLKEMISHAHCTTAVKTPLLKYIFISFQGMLWLLSAEDVLMLREGWGGSRLQSCVIRTAGTGDNCLSKQCLRLTQNFRPKHPSWLSVRHSTSLYASQNPAFKWSLQQKRCTYSLEERTKKGLSIGS